MTGRGDQLVTLGNIRPGGSIVTNITYNFNRHLDEHCQPTRPATCDTTLMKDEGAIAVSGSTMWSPEFHFRGNKPTTQEIYRAYDHQKFPNNKKDSCCTGKQHGTEFVGDFLNHRIHYHGMDPAKAYRQLDEFLRSPDDTWEGDNNTLRVQCSNFERMDAGAPVWADPDRPGYVTSVRPEHISLMDDTSIVGTYAGTSVPDPEDRNWNTTGWTTVNFADNTSSNLGAIWDREYTLSFDGPMRTAHYSDYEHVRPKPPTAKQLRDAQRARNRLKRDALRNAKQLRLANEKSMKLLKQWLSTEEYNYLMEKGELELPSKEKEEIYIVKRDAHARVVVKDKNTKKTKHYLCVNPVGFPEGDMLLSKILAIKTDEKQFLQTAIAHQVP